MGVITDTQLNALVSQLSDKMNELNLAAAAAFRGGLAIADTPTGNGFWLPIESGTYTNAGNIVVDLEDGLTVLSTADNGSTWTDLVVPIDLTAPGVVEEGNTEAVSGGVVYDKISEIATRVYIFENDVIGEYSNSNRYFSNSNVFIGFGFNYGILKNFNQITIKVGQIIDTSNAVSEVNIKIRKNDYTGEELAFVTKSVSIPEGEIHDITFDFPLIENNDNSTIWIEFWCNGKTGLFRSTLPAVNYRYKSTTSTYGDFELSSNVGTSTMRPFALSINKAESFMKFDEKNISDSVDLNDERPVKSSAVAESLKDINSVTSVIQPVFVNENVNVLGSDSVYRSSSTFAAWGQLYGKLSDFNRLGYIFNAYNELNIPTVVRCVVRKNSYDGDILFDITKNVDLEYNVPKKIYFDLQEVFENDGNDDIFISYTSDGYFTSYTQSRELPNAERIRYTTTKNSINLSSVATSDGILYTELIKGNFEYHNSDEEIAYIEEKISVDKFNTPHLLLPSKVWLFPGLQYNIFNKNVCVPEFGDNLNNYRLNFNGNVGAQFNRGFRLTATEDLDQNITLNLLKGREILTTKTQNLLSSDVNNGSGITRNVLLIGDSTVNGSNISTPFKAVFDTDVMNINLIGTLGNTGVKHEGRGGWTINDYATIGRKLYVVPVSGITTAPSIGAVYKQIAGNDFRVTEVNVTGGEGYISFTRNSGADMEENGTLTKQSGSGDNTINYTGASITSQNPFYNPVSDFFDIEYYLDETSQTLGDGDWIGFQLGVNDVFNITSLNSATNKVNEMIDQMNEIIANIHSYNADIRIALCVTFPPADQDAFGHSYSTGQLSEMYTKTGLVTWQNKLIETFDNDISRNNNVFLVSAHLNLDVDYNYPSSEVAVNSRNSETITMQTNGVHPSTTGYAQIADMYAGLIKYFG